MGAGGGVSTSGYLLVVGSIVGIGGAFWRWYGVKMGDGWSSQIAGVESLHGKIAVVAFALAIGAHAYARLFPAESPRARTARVVRMAGALGALAAGFVFWFTRGSSSGVFEAGVGPGLYISLLGGAAAVFGSIPRPSSKPA